MEKMIKVINDNLRSVIKGIDTHKEDTEKSLAAIKADMDEKIVVASAYKNEVENSRHMISSLENEISELETDLNDLTVKFGAKNFNELLAAGNKEINTKIIEKRALITEESEKILEVTEKAHQLKEELVKLKERRAAAEATLEKATILKNYYDARIKDVISYAEENPDDLISYTVNKPQEELLVDDSELDNIAIESVVDGSVFEEIDSISTNDVDEELIKEVLERPELSDIEIKEDSENDIPKKAIDLSMTQQLDDIILAANDILSQKEIDVINKAESTSKEDMSEESELPNVAANKKADDEALPYIEPTMDEEDVIDIDVSDDEELVTIDLQNMDSPVKINEDNDFSLNYLKEDMNVFASPDNAFYEELQACNLDPDRFKEEDIIKLEKEFNSDNTNKFIKIMVKHNIGITAIYDSVDVLINVTPQNLDQMLSLLEKTSATSEDIEHIFKYLAHINITKLETTIETLKNGELVEILYELIPYDNTTQLADMLGLDEMEEGVFRTNTSDDMFKMMNLFPEIVLTNYQVLEKLEIKNLKECITKYPTRFILNPSHFNEILDKYDTDDLIRCINKNAAVIDRL